VQTTADALRRAGEALRERLGEAAGDGLAPGAEEMLTEAVYGGIWARPGLAIEERMICTLAALGLAGVEAPLARAVHAALDLGLAPRSVLEVFVQCGLYGGFPTTERASGVARDVFAARGVDVAPDPPREARAARFDDLGRETMAALHGERAQGGYAAPDHPTTGALYAIAVRYGYGDLWSRPGLDHRQRLLCALAAFTALGFETQLVKFARAARDNGFTREAVIEAVMQTAPCAGFPRALNALARLAEAI